MPTYLHLILSCFGFFLIFWMFNFAFSEQSLTSKFINSVYKISGVQLTSLEKIPLAIQRIFLRLIDVILLVVRKFPQSIYRIIKGIAKFLLDILGEAIATLIFFAILGGLWYLVKNGFIYLGKLI